MTPGIHVLDTRYLGQDGAVASYLIETADGPILIEVGPANTVERLRAALAEHGYGPEDIGHAFVTHIHLDHAGAAGWIAKHGTHIHVHAFGAPHLVDPERLLRSAQRIYGEDMNRLWGTMTPTPGQQVHPLDDGDVVEIGGVRVRCLDTPGHARHHLSFIVETSEGPVAFTGDAAASHMPDSTFISLQTPPPEFDHDAWKHTIARLRDEQLVRMYPTHFGPCDDPGGRLERLSAELDRHVTFIERVHEQGRSEQEIIEAYGEWMDDLADEHAVPADRRSFFVGRNVKIMNVMGVLRAMYKRAEQDLSSAS